MLLLCDSSHIAEHFHMNHQFTQKSQHSAHSTEKESWDSQSHSLAWFRPQSWRWHSRCQEALSDMHWYMGRSDGNPQAKDNWTRHQKIHVLHRQDWLRLLWNNQHASARQKLVFRAGRMIAKQTAPRRRLSDWAPKSCTHMHVFGCAFKFSILATALLQSSQNLEVSTKRARFKK